jgi:hypothetical protein
MAVMPVTTLRTMVHFVAAVRMMHLIAALGVVHFPIPTATSALGTVFYSATTAPALSSSAIIFGYGGQFG